MTPLTLSELRLRQATLAHRAECKREQWRTAVPTSPKALSLGKQVKALQSRADEYGSLIRVAEASS